MSLSLFDAKKREHTVEVIVVILLGVTALLTAWATWVGSLHAGNQATNYTISTNLSSEGNSEYNAATQTIMQDMILWNEVADMQFDIIYAYNNDDDELVDQYCEKLYFKLYENLSDSMAEAIAWDFPDSNDYTSTILDWMDYEEAVTTPFADQDYMDSYFDTANDLLVQSEEALEQGQEDNTNSDTYGLVTIVYSISLFLLGVVSTIKNYKNKYALLGIASVSIVVATVFMLTIPMPTGFSIANFF